MMNEFDKIINQHPENKEEVQQVQPPQAPVSPHIPQQPQQKIPPKAPQVPYPPVAPQTAQYKEYQSYHHYCTQHPYGQPYPQGQPYYQMPYTTPRPQMPPKEKMSGGLKAVLIVSISTLLACLIGFVCYVSVNTDIQLNTKDFETPTEEYTVPETEDYFDFDIQDETEPEKYTETDMQEATDPDYKGVKLNKKPKKKNSSKYNASYTYEKLQKAVVGVVCYYEMDEENDTYQSQGTGIILSNDGYIVTNSHVIGNSRYEYLIKVITSDKKEYKAGVVGYDNRSDLAVLKIDAENLSYAEFGNSKETRITEDVIAIGNPSGLEFQNSVTKGIVSALDREVSTSNNVKFLQIDAAINPGNSGGPLCNMYGQVIGINTSKIASEVYEGMGFAIPSATMKDIVDDIIRNGYVTNRVKIGITGTVVYKSKVGVNGIQIAEITPGGPMYGVGVKAYDVITAVDGEEITSFSEIYTILEKHKEGDKVEITLYRPSLEKSFDVTVKLQIDKAED